MLMVYFQILSLQVLRVWMELILLNLTAFSVLIDFIEGQFMSNQQKGFTPVLNNPNPVWG